MFFDLEAFDDHESVSVVSDRHTGLRAIIAIHNTTLGPAHGGVRYWRYPTDEEAITDALRLSRGMTYKNVMAGLPFGGGKSVILAGDRPKEPALLRAFGRAVQGLAGRYIAAEDVGITPWDIREMSEETPHVCGLPTTTVTANQADPSPYTALGVLLSMQAGWSRLTGDSGLAGVHVRLQGAGGVGSHLARALVAAGARVTVSDIDPERSSRLSSELGIETMDPAGVYEGDVDIFAPCALGGVLNPVSIGQLQARLVCGGANNQLANPADGQALRKKGILYLPDFLINAGGVIHTTSQLLSRTRDEVLSQISMIPARLDDVLDRADRDGTDTQASAEAEARDLLTSAREDVSV